MSEHTVQMPRRLALQETVNFACDLERLPAADNYIFDFAQTGRIEPFAMLFLSSEFQRARSNRPDARFTVRNHTKCTYAAHMGFFKAFGLDFGKAPGEAAGSGTYLPITIYDTGQIRKDARNNSVAVGEFIENKSAEMAAILARSRSGHLFDVLTFSIREIIRNVVEHSEADQFGFCAQYWPQYNSVEVAIIDRGIGVRAGLRNNPYLEISNDHEAINLSLMPGISGRYYKGVYQDPNDEWANSGFGLYMTSRICREGGSFFIASGRTGLYLSEHKRRYLDTPYSGTGLKLTLNTERLESLQAMTRRFAAEARNVPRSVSASVASTMLSRDFQGA